MFIVNVHKAVSLVDHMLLASAGVLEHSAAEEAKVTKLDTLGNVGKESFQTDAAIHIGDEEGMALSHVVETTLNTCTFLVTEETNTKRV
jgi:hypothetical protein